MDFKYFALAGLAGVALIGTALAQNNSEPQQPSPAEPKKTIPEKIAPPEKSVPERKSPGGNANEPLGDRLNRTDGVVRPPENIDPKVQVPAPVPDPGTTRVIPPPGSPGNPSPVRPK